MTSLSINFPALFTSQQHHSRIHQIFRIAMSDLENEEKRFFDEDQDEEEEEMGEDTGRPTDSDDEEEEEDEDEEEARKVTVKPLSSQCP